MFRQGQAFCVRVRADCGSAGWSGLPLQRLWLEAAKRRSLLAVGGSPQNWAGLTTAAGLGDAAAEEIGRTRVDAAEAARNPVEAAVTSLHAKL